MHRGPEIDASMIQRMLDEIEIIFERGPDLPPDEALSISFPPGWTDSDDTGHTDHTGYRQRRAHLTSQVRVYCRHRRLPTA